MSTKTKEYFKELEECDIKYLLNITAEEIFSPIRGQISTSESFVSELIEIIKMFKEENNKLKKILKREKIQN